MKYLLLIFVFFTLASFGGEKFSVSNLRCESVANPVGVSVIAPRFSWWITSSYRDIRQSNYHIMVAETTEDLNKNRGTSWDSKVCTSDQSTQVAYAGRKLEAGRKYFWKVKVCDRSGHSSEWSETAWFSTGLLTSKDWGEARWIAYENLPDSMRVVPGIHGSGNDLGKKATAKSVVPLFRKEFELNKKIENATLYISGLGHYEASINGETVGKSFLSPGWTDYDITCLYNTFDVTSMFQQGKNALGVVVGNGFYYINRQRYRKLVIAQGFPKLICKVKITFADGTSSEFDSGPDWKCTPSPIGYSSIYGGEDYDATLEQKGWNRPEFDDSSWKSAIYATIPTGKLAAETDYPVTVNQTIPVRKILKREPGKFLYDFGQNGSGIVELKVKGKRGSVIKLTPGELITSDNEINQKASGSPYFFTYTLKGDGMETWRPKFSYYGFRYVMLEGGVPEKVAENNDLPLVMQLDMLHTCNSSPKSGDFSCSNQLFNRIYTLIDWAVRSNLQSVVTDCPHREKLGWLEQTYLMGASLHYNYELAPLYRKTILDMIDAQSANGLVPDIAPEYTQFVGGFRDSPEWGSAAVILPWMLWEWYGDKSIVQEALPMMEKYASYLGTLASDHILSHGLGDWFDYGPKSPGEAQLTPKALTATAIYYYDLQLLGKMQRLCGKAVEAATTDKLSAQVRTAFNKKFFDPATKVYSTGSQTAMAMPMCVGLVEDKFRKEVFRNLVGSIEKSGKALTAGDIGFHFLVKALEEGGGSQLLFDMNFRDDVPGYGFQLKKGATALTESWPALEQVSNNHLMLGHLMEWFYTGLGGIKQDPGSQGFERIIIRPEIVGDLTFAKAGYNSVHGRIRSEWKLEKDEITMEVEIPVNTTGTIFFPVSAGARVMESGKQVTLSVTSDGKYFCKFGSGSYIFNMKIIKNIN
ncbi:MAG TPA: family 78 glycoside hydrolase catalytic domain [Prolixibacteraceae bacterium]